MIWPPPNNISWYYSEPQTWFAGFKESIKFIKGSPRNISMNPENNNLIIDDLFQETNKYMVQLFTASSHHRNISIIFLTQHFFYKGPHRRNISLNADYVVFFKNPRDKSQIFHLARQMYPDNANFLVEAYKDATCEPYSYLLIDLTPVV